AEVHVYDVFSRPSGPYRSGKMTTDRHDGVGVLLGARHARRVARLPDRALRVRIPVVAREEMPVQVGDGVAEHIVVHLARGKGAGDGRREPETAVEQLR